MGKMTSSTIEALYSNGKDVYERKINLKEATNKVVNEFKGEIADKSAEFYIKLYTDYMTGKGSTWNQNSDLALYYVEHITAEAGMEFGKNAFIAAMKYAEHAKRRSLISNLNDLRKKLFDDGIPLTPDYHEEDVAESHEQKTQEKMPMTTKECLSFIKKYIAARGFAYLPSLIENFYLSLKSKPFVILAGTSGTGKTRLVKLFAEAIGADYKLVSVRPDWSDGSDLFGHNDLNGNFIEGPICSAFDAAKRDPQKPVFLCLDEMNLARVEYYLSDFLSVIESREKSADGKITTDAIAQYEEGIPDNLYIIGTVNMDETTFPFSKKVLDRANTIEFSYVDLLPQFDMIDPEAEPLQLPNIFLRTEYLVLARDCEAEKDFVEKVCDELQKLNEILRKANAHVGYRVRDEIVFYMLNNLKAENLLTYEQALDNEIMQKILPRIQGSTAAVKNMLAELFKFCMGDYSGLDIESDSAGQQMQVLADSAKYPESAKKIGYMMTRYEEDGFTSYWL